MGQKQRNAQQRGIERTQQRQQRHLGQQHQHYGYGTKSTYARVLHDLQRAVAVQRAAQPIGHISQAVFMKGTRHPHTEHGAQHRSHQRRKRAGWQ